MYEHKAVGPNLKTYYYYTNEVAESKNSTKEVFVIATGMEGTGALYDEVAEYLTKKGHALYAIDEWKYGKTGDVNKKSIYKNWGKKDAYYAAYNIHALTVIAKREHPQAKICLIGNDFGAMLSLYLIKEFPEVIDRVVTIGWGMPRLQDVGFLIGSYIRKFFLYDSGTCKFAHFSKNKSLAIRFEANSKYSWTSSDPEQVKKLVNGGYMDTAGTVGHYFYYYLRKVFTPHLFMRMKNTDRATPMMFVSGDHDLTTLRGRKTKALETYYRHRGFKNVSSVVVEGRHQLLFDTCRFDLLDAIINWCETGEMVGEVTSANSIKEYNEEAIVAAEYTSEAEIVVVEETPIENPARFEALQEADDSLLIKSVR
jgi:alpha-beta hydrolase superfamily lysophospholipase